MLIDRELLCSTSIKALGGNKRVYFRILLINYEYLGCIMYAQLKIDFPSLFHITWLHSFLFGRYVLGCLYELKCQMVPQ